MIKIKEHKEKIEKVQEQINNCKNNKIKLQLIKHLHKLNKDLMQCKIYQAGQ